MNQSKKLNFLNNKEIISKKIKIKNLKKDNTTKKSQDIKAKVKLNKTNLEYDDVNKNNNIINNSRVNFDFINEIKNSEKIIERIKYLQLWWKTIFQMIKIQKYIRGFLQRIKLSKIMKLKSKINPGIVLLSKSIKNNIYKSFRDKIKNFHVEKMESPRKKFNKNKFNQSIESRKNNINNNISNEHLSFEKIFMTSRKLNQKQKPKIKNSKLNFTSNQKILPQRNLIKRNNLNEAAKTTQEKEKESIRVTQHIPAKKVCQFFNTSSNFNLGQKNHNNQKCSNSNSKKDKIEISHKIAHKTKKLIKYRNEINNLNKFKSYRPESLQNKFDKKNLMNNNTSRSPNLKKNLELEYISTHEPRFHCPKKLFNLNNDKPNNANIIRVQKKIFKNKNNDIKQESEINLRSRSLENRTNQEHKSFSNKLDKNKKINNKNNKSESKGKNISDFIKQENKENNDFANKIIFQYRNNNNYNNNCKTDMIKWLNSWEKKNINKLSNTNKLKNITFLIQKLISFNIKKTGNIFLYNLKHIKNLNILKNVFAQYKHIIETKKIFEKLKRVQRIKIYEQNIEKEKINLLEKLVMKYTSLKRCLIRWKIFIYQYNKFYEEKNIVFSTSDISNINDDINDSTNDYFNKSQPEIGSLRINNYNFVKNKYNISNIKSTQKDRNNNINININYNLITNNNSLEQGIYKKKKINVPKTKQYQNNSCFIGEYAKEINDNDNTINEQKDFMNNSMIVRRIKIKKKENNNNIYFPKHVKPNYIQNDFDYVTYKNMMQFDNNKRDENKNKGVIHKRINLKFQKIFEMKNNF